MYSLPMYRGAGLQGPVSAGDYTTSESSLHFLVTCRAHPCVTFTTIRCVPFALAALGADAAGSHAARICRVGRGLGQGGGLCHPGESVSFRC